MPRRPPPSSLLLAQGPLPTRGQPKHTLPSPPRPILSPINASRSAVASQIREPLGRQRSRSVEDAMVFSVCNRSGNLVGGNRWSYMMENGVRFSSMESIAEPASRRGSLDSTLSSNQSRPNSPDCSPSEWGGKLPGHSWARSSSPTLTFDVDILLALPKPVAISP